MQDYIGSNVRILRNEARMSIEDLAEKTGLTKERIEEIESGNTKVYLKELMVLCPVLHIGEEDIQERNLAEERSQAESRLKTSNSRENYNWYYGDKKKVLRYVLDLILVPIVFIISYFLLKVLLPIYFAYIEINDPDIVQALFKSYQFGGAYVACAMVSLIFIIIEVFTRFKVPFHFWYIFFAGIIITLIFVAALILVIPFYGYCFYQAVIKKGKNR